MWTAKTDQTGRNPESSLGAQVILLFSHAVAHIWGQTVVVWLVLLW